MLVYLHSLLERPVRLGVRTGDFHSSNRGSIPLRATQETRAERGFFFVRRGIAPARSHRSAGHFLRAATGTPEPQQ